MPKPPYRPVMPYQPEYPVPEGLKHRYSRAEAVERLGSAPPRSLPVDIIPSSIGSRLALFAAITASAGAVGVITGLAGYQVGAAVGGIVRDHNESGMFIDRAGAFWIAIGIIIALVAVGGTCYSLGRFESATVRSTLVEYRRAVEAWRSEFEAWARESRETVVSTYAAIDARDLAFRDRYIAGRTWLAEAFADLSIERDAVRQFVLRNKPHPGVSSANVLRESTRRSARPSSRIASSGCSSRVMRSTFPNCSTIGS